MADAEPCPRSSKFFPFASLRSNNEEARFPTGLFILENRSIRPRNGVGNCE